MKRVIFCLKFNTESKEELLEQYVSFINENKKNITITPNLDFLRIAYKNKEVRDVFNKGTICTIDGTPILWIAKWTKVKDCKHKVPGSDLAMDVLKLMNEHHYSLYLFGGKEGVAEKAKEKINENYPNIEVKGTLTPEFGFENNEELCQKYIEQMNAANADVVFLCTGAPKTEKFYIKHEDMFANSTYFSIGATIDFIAGSIKRAPKWMRKIGLEWLYRMFKDFRRLFKRYWLDGWFLVKVWFMTHFKKKKVQKMMVEIENENLN